MALIDMLRPHLFVSPVHTAPCFLHITLLDVTHETLPHFPSPLNPVSVQACRNLSAQTAPQILREVPRSTVPCPLVDKDPRARAYIVG